MNLFKAGQKLTAADLNTLNTKGTYSPTIAGSGGNPVINGTSFLTGKWWRVGLIVSFTIDLFIDESADFGGTSWRITLPFVWDSAFHDGGVLAGVSDNVGNFGSRSSTSSQSTTGMCVLDSAGRLIFYGNATNSSLGPGDFGTQARLKAFGQYVASDPLTPS
jgi:hypothetical protein